MAYGKVTRAGGSMSYSEAMQEAGAEILEFAEFGSYQGDWWAKVRWEGNTGWVKGAYGSCSGCDAFQAEFSFTDESCDEHKYEYPKPSDCLKCDEEKAAYQDRLATFGRTYLVNMMTQEEAERESFEYDWESEADNKYTKEGEQTEFIRSRAV